MNKTKIDWCTHTINPIVGCKHGCEWCYARNLVETRLKKQHPNGFEHITYYPERTDDLHKGKGRRVFVGSMCDLFGEWVDKDFIIKVLKKCAMNEYNTYFFLTKNPARYSEFLKFKKVNMLFGTSFIGGFGIRNKLNYKMVNFISLEPYCGKAFEIPQNIKWVIIGSMTGKFKSKYPTNVWELTKMIKQCIEKRIPLFLKDNVRLINEDARLQMYPNSVYTDWMLKNFKKYFDIKHVKLINEDARTGC